MKVGYWVMSKISMGGGGETCSHIYVIFVVCGGIPYLLWYYVTLCIPKNRLQN